LLDYEHRSPEAERAPSPAPPAAEPPRKVALRRLAIAAIVLVVGLGGVYAWRRHELALRDASQLVLLGNIDVRQVNLSFKVDGRIDSLAVDEGDAVTAGQVVARLDRRYFEDDLRLMRARRDGAAANLARAVHGSRPEEIEEARAQVAQQQATLERARQDYARLESLVGKGAVSRENFDAAKAALGESEARLTYLKESLRLAELGPRQEDIDAARAELAAQAASLIESERRLADSELIAPSDGVILTRAREKGAIVGPGETVFALTLASPVWARTYVNEVDLGRIHPGLRGEVHTDSAPGKIYHGQIGFVSPTAEFTPKTVETRELRTDLVYRLRVVIDNPDQGLRQGMPVTINFRLDGRP